jgi:hypothetical protein
MIHNVIPNLPMPTTRVWVEKKIAHLFFQFLLLQHSYLKKPFPSNNWTTRRLVAYIFLSSQTLDPQFPKLYYILDFWCIQWDLVYLCNNVSRFVIVDFTTTTSYIFSRKKFKVNNPILVLSLIYPIPIYNTPTTQHIIDWSNHTF